MYGHKLDQLAVWLIFLFPTDSSSYSFFNNKAFYLVVIFCGENLSFATHYHLQQQQQQQQQHEHLTILYRIYLIIDTCALSQK
jgi:hypothetical protein